MSARSRSRSIPTIEIHWADPRGEIVDPPSGCGEPVSIEGLARPEVVRHHRVCDPDGQSERR